MKSANSWAANISKFIGFHLINMFDAFGTGICTLAILACLMFLDGWVLKLAGAAGCFVLVVLIIYLADRLKEKIQ